MSYHPSRESAQAHEAFIDKTQTSDYIFTDGEKLENEKKHLQLVLNGKPPTELRQRAETRMAEITRQLEEKRIEFLPPVDVVTDLLEELKDISVEYPAELLAARRAEFKSRLAAPQEATSRF